MALQLVPYLPFCQGYYRLSYFEVLKICQTIKSQYSRHPVPRSICCVELSCSIRCPRNRLSTTQKQIFNSYLSLSISIVYVYYCLPYFDVLKSYRTFKSQGSRDPKLLHRPVPRSICCVELSCSICYARNRLPTTYTRV